MYLYLMLKLIISLILIVYLSFLKLCNPMYPYDLFVCMQNLFKVTVKSLVGDKWKG